jgi:hypothetical protein
MNNLVIGVDIAKRVFQLHWVEESGEIKSVQLRRCLPHRAFRHRRRAVCCSWYSKSSGAARAGLMASQYAGHSLRSGFLTSGAQQRASIFKMQAQSRHKSLDVLSGYVRAHELFEDHAGEGLLTSKKSDDGS